MIQPAVPVSGEKRSALAIMISVMNPAFSQRRSFEAGLQAVLSQREESLECIAIGGGSADGSEDILLRPPASFAANKFDACMGVCRSVADTGRYPQPSRPEARLRQSPRLPPDGQGRRIEWARLLSRIIRGGGGRTAAMAMGRPNAIGSCDR